jgi:HAD superfamily hydrolase (TIGR01509 family)
MMIQGFKPIAVIFDFDGVIVDSLSLHLDAWRQAYQMTFDLPLDDVEGLAGRSTEKIARILAERCHQPHRSTELATSKKQILKVMKTAIPLIAGARRAMDILSRQSVPYGIASNAPRDFIFSTLNAHNLSVPIVLGVDDVKSPKPAPDIFLLCAKRLGISVTDHQNVFVFEDSTHGIEAAVKAGMIPIGVATQHSDAMLISSGAKAVCRDLEHAFELGLLS